MKALRYGISCLLAAGLAFTAACGGSSDDGGGSAAGASAGGASHGAGAPGNAGRGSVAGTGSTTGPNNPACPATAPEDATACMLSGGQGTTCSYSGMSCRCARAGGMREWQCSASLVCPATKPTAGEACTPGAGSCQYDGMSICSCSAQSSTWACFGGMIGAGGAGSGFGGLPGFPGVGGGFSFGGAPGSGAAGDSSGTTCPATKPAADGACTGTGACPYTGGGCVCSSDKWTCL